MDYWNALSDAEKAQEEWDRIPPDQRQVLACFLEIEYKVVVVPGDFCHLHIKRRKTPSRENTTYIE